MSYRKHVLDQRHLRLSQSTRGGATHNFRGHESARNRCTKIYLLLGAVKTRFQLARKKLPFRDSRFDHRGQMLLDISLIAKSEHTVASDGSLCAHLWAEFSHEFQRDQPAYSVLGLSNRDIGSAFGGLDSPRATHHCRRRMSRFNVFIEERAQSMVHGSDDPEFSHYCPRGNSNRLA
jgi:hypothetical protein